MKRGILYIAFGEKYVAEAVHSARSLARHSPGLPRVLFTDCQPRESAFDDVRVVSVTHARPKVDHLVESPFEETLYLDSDTRVVADISDVFGLLQRCDVAMAHDFSRKRRLFSTSIEPYGAIPYAFPEMNGGVILYRSNPTVRAFLERWRELHAQYRAITNGWDQPSLRVALWESTDLRLLTLPVEFNVRSASVRRRVSKQAARNKDAEMLKPRILHWHGLHVQRWWHRFSPNHMPHSY